MYVIADGLEITVAAAVHDERLVAPAEQVPEQFVPPVEARGVSAEEPLHARDQIGLGRFHDQMKMIVHETIGMHLPVGLGARLRQRLQEQLLILLRLEDRLAAVPPVEEVIDRTAYSTRSFLGMGLRLREIGTCVNSED